MDRQDTPFRKLNGWLWTKMTGVLFSLNLRDIDCAFKLYKRAIFDNIKMESQGALIDTEILARAARKGYTITQTRGAPLSANGRPGRPAATRRSFCGRSKKSSSFAGRIVSGR